MSLNFFLGLPMHVPLPAGSSPPSAMHIFAPPSHLHPLALPHGFLPLPAQSAPPSSPPLLPPALLHFLVF